MAGELVPLVMIPRYTTYAGTATDFVSVGMDVTEYDSAMLYFWRGAILGGGSPSFVVNCEESTDQNVWSLCNGVSANEAVSENVEKQFLPELAKRWFRVRVTLAGTAPVVSCWAVGYLVQRLR